MVRQIRSIMNKAHIRLGSTNGMTMGEMLATVAIVIILMGVGFISLTTYQRSLAQTERDGVAKEIFIAAQNHLTMARGEGYYGLPTTGNGYGTKESSNSSIYYFVVNSDNNSITDSEDSIMGMMLPFGSIDETVRKGGSYIIRYEPSSGTVLDVFYTTESGSPERFNKKLTSDLYVKATGLVDTDTANHKEERKEVDPNEENGKWVLGWYGGADVKGLPDNTLNKNLILNVVNSHTLYVEVTDRNKKNCRLIIKGITSGARMSISLDDITTLNDRKTATSSDDNYYKLVIDDISTVGRHFADLNNSSTSLFDGDKRFIAGENLEIQAISYDNTKKSNIVYSDVKTVNSLYGGITEEKERDATTNSIKAGADSVYKASVYTIRHLENLEKAISNSGFTFETVFQTGDIDLTVFEASEQTSSDKKVFKFNDSSGVDGYYPVSYDSAFLYDGLGHSISNIRVRTSNNNEAALFAAPHTGSKFKNIELIDFDVQGGIYAGALAGTLSGSNVNNVVAHNSKKNDSESSATIRASKSDEVQAAGGGLVGLMTGGSIKYSGAALIVNSSDYAGGLVGKAETGTDNVKPKIEACYSGGHTDQGEYYDHKNDKNNGKGNELYNIKAGDSETNCAGGLIGDAGSSIITNCYSTCSAEGGKAGGLVGQADDANINDSYCTGLVGGRTNTHSNAFIGSGSFIGLGNFYYSIINEYTEDGKDEIKYKEPFSGYKANSDSVRIRAFDESYDSSSAADVFNTFSGDGEKWHIAKPYDETLLKYYKNGASNDDECTYCFKTVTQMAADSYNPSNGTDYDALGTSYFVNTHYGDWPAPEVFIVNE